eukprot:scaffold1.g5824.t1
MRRPALPQALERLRCFSAWVAARSGHISCFCFHVVGATINLEDQEAGEAIQREVWGVVQGMLAALAPSLAELDLEWFGTATLGPWVTAMPRLRSLAVEAHNVVVPQSLAALTALTNLRLKAGLETIDMAAAALPSTLEALALSWAEQGALPACVAGLPRLRRLQLSGAHVSAGLEHLATLAQLQELALNECQLKAPPREISGLTRLRALYLDSNPFPSTLALRQVLNAVLTPLEELEVLGLSNCHLSEVPPCLLARRVTAFYAEDNRLDAIPDAPLFHNVRILSLDWKAALASSAVLAKAASLRDLYLCRPPSIVSGLVNSPELQEEQLAALSDAIAGPGLPSLRQLTFVLFDSTRLRQRVPTTNWMLGLAARLARDRPGVEVSSIASTGFFAVTAEQMAAHVAGP